MRAILIKDQIKYVCYSTRIYLKKKKKKKLALYLLLGTEKEKERENIIVSRQNEGRIERKERAKWNRNWRRKSAVSKFFVGRRVTVRSVRHLIERKWNIHGRFLTRANLCSGNDECNVHCIVGDGLRERGGRKVVLLVVGVAHWHSAAGVRK